MKILTPKSLSVVLNILFITVAYIYTKPIYSWSLFGLKDIPTSTAIVPVTRQITLMLDPAGDAKYTGRTIEDHFERGITLACAQELKTLIESQENNIRVILTRFPGETLEPLQNASFANRLQVDCYISLHFYAIEQAPYTFSVYHMLHKTTDIWHTKQKQLSFQTYDNAHLLSLPSTIKLGTEFIKALKPYESDHHFTCNPLLGIPCKPLLGITAPALMFEIGITKKDDWRTLIEPLSMSIKHILSVLPQGKTDENT